MRVYVAVILFTLSLFWPGEAVTSCKKLSPCSCETETGKIISLDGLARQKTGDSEQDFTWEPCGSFDIGTLKGVSLAMFVKASKTYTDIGSLENSYFSVSNKDVSFYLPSTDKLRTSLVKLTCGEGASEWAFKAQGIPFYTFELTSPYSCPRTLSDNSSSLSIGSIITITFFVIFISYFFFGLVINVAVRKREGSERIPNVMFWTALPGLIRDGFKFTKSRICGARSKTYDQI